MTGSHLFTLGLFQKRFNSTSRVTGPAINMGNTKGRASSTRMFNYCKQRSSTPYLCINQFVTMNKPPNYSQTIYKRFSTEKKYSNKNMTKEVMTEDLINEDVISKEFIIKEMSEDVNKDIVKEDNEDIVNEDIGEEISEEEKFQIIIEDVLPELTEIYMKKTISDEWFDNNDA